MVRFHPLTVTEIRRTTRDAVVLSLVPHVESAALFDFVQGQYLTFRREFDTETLRRSYSICVERGAPALQVAIKRVEGGAFSNWAFEELRVGDTLEAMPPAGNFHLPLVPDHAGHYLAFAVGSGITPILSLLATTLATEPASTFTLVYGNRSVNSIMFREELEDLKNRYMGRMSVVHILANGAQDIDLFSGRIDAEKCEQLFKGWIDVARVDYAFICGPEPMMKVVSQALRDQGLDDSRIRFELFATSQPGRLPRNTPTAVGTDVQPAQCIASITLDGTRHEVTLQLGQETVLQAALAADLDAPFACTAGVCSTCRAKVLAGDVEMEKNHALEDYEVAQGYVLTCQCYPLTEELVVSYDE